jgi:hypothetical protein
MEQAREVAPKSITATYAAGMAVRFDSNAAAEVGTNLDLLFAEHVKTYSGRLSRA